LNFPIVEEKGKRPAPTLANGGKGVVFCEKRIQNIRENKIGGGEMRNLMVLRLKKNICETSFHPGDRGRRP